MSVIWTSGGWNRPTHSPVTHGRLECSYPPNHSGTCSYISAVAYYYNSRVFISCSPH